jgi:hypothetical protein
MKEWREIILGKTIWNLHPILVIQRSAIGRNTENWHITGTHNKKFEENGSGHRQEKQVEYVP